MRVPRRATSVKGMMNLAHGIRRADGALIIAD